MTKTTIILAMTLAFVAGTLVTFLMSDQNAEATDISRKFTAQTTAMSDVDPVPGHSAHQLVVAIPPRDDGMIWKGVVTWTSSVPVDVVVLHEYNPSTKIDERGTPLIAPSPFTEGEIAITLVHPDSGSIVPSGSMSFVGSALAFHTIDGTPFTITYTVDAFAYKINN